MSASLGDVSPELRPMLKRIPSPPIERGWVRALIRVVLALMPATRRAGVTLTKVGGVARGLRIHTPAQRQSRAALLWFHGGGFLLGHPKLDDRLCAETAALLGIPVIAAGYRLGPSHPFPAALDDGLSAWTWLERHAADLDIDPLRIAIGGQSAGGGLAASLIQRLRDDGKHPVAQWLFCPMLDDRTTMRDDVDPTGHFIWTNARNTFAWASYLSGTPVPSKGVPARRERLDGLPQTWIGVGDIDLFHDEDRAYADRLRASGVDVTFDVVPGAPHGFEAWAPDTQIARRFVARAQRWLAETLADR